MKELITLRTAATMIKEKVVYHVNKDLTHMVVEKRISLLGFLIKRELKTVIFPRYESRDSFFKNCFKLGFGVASFGLTGSLLLQG